MRVLVTGAAGFLGSRLAAELAANGTLRDRRNAERPITEIVLTDTARIPRPEANGVSIRAIEGDLTDPAFVRSLAKEECDSIFHLASYLTLQAEQDPTRAYAVNVDALRQLLEAATGCPKLVFTSSIAVFGGELPEEVGDDVVPSPTTTYGAHKAMNELLIADYARYDRVDGRSLRLPIVVTRPGTPLPAISDRVAGLIREPLGGIDLEAPLARDTALPLASAGAVARALIRMHDLDPVDLPQRRAFNLPALTVTVGDLVEAGRRNGATGTVTFAPDPQVQAIVDGWPAQFVSAHASGLGIRADDTSDALIADYLASREAGDREVANGEVACG